MNEVTVSIQTRINESNEVVVSGRELHEFLEVGTAYKDWFPRMTDYGFEEGTDYLEIIEEVDAQKRARTYKQINHIIKIDMAKEISMIQRSEKGKQARQYFLRVEREFKEQQKPMTRQQLTESLAIEVSKELDFVKNDVAHLKTQLNERMTIDYGEQLLLLRHKNKRVESLHNDSHAHINRSLMHRKAWSDYKRAFGVSSYRDTLIKDLPEAINYLKAWRPLV